MTNIPPPREPNGSPRRARPARPVTPIISEQPWNGRITTGSAHIAIVVVYRSGEHEVLWPHNRQRVLLHRRPTTVYEIDLGLHQSTIAADLPSRDESCSFRARISAQWRVLDPSAVVRHRLYDVAATLAPHLLRHVRRIARGYDIAEAALAEDEINIRFGSHKVDITDQALLQQAMREAVKGDFLGAEYGLWTRIIAQLSLDEAGAEHAAKMTRLRRAIEEEKAEQELRLLQESHQQQITADRITLYRGIIAAGDIDRFALQLAENPGDIAAIDTIIREELLASRRDTIDFVARMVDSGVVERWEISDQAREALGWLKEATSRVIHDQPHREAIDAGHRAHRRGRGEPIEVEAEIPVEDPADNGETRGDGSSHGINAA